MVVIGDRPVLSSKRGLLVPSRDPGVWDWLGTLKFQKVKSLHCDGTGRIVGSLFDKKEIHAIDADSGTAERLAVLSDEIEWVGQVAGETLTLTKASIYKITTTGPIALALPEPQTGWHGASCPQGVLVWTENGAWVGNGTSGRWLPVKGWPGKAKKVAVSEAGGLALLTDGSRLVTVTLPLGAS